MTNDMPTWDQFMAPVLRLMLDGQTRGRRQIYDGVADAVGLSSGQRAIVLNSGSLKWEGRIGWAITYLNMAGAVQRPSRGQYVITDNGRAFLSKHPNGIAEKDLNELEGYVSRKKQRTTRVPAEQTVEPSDVGDLDPEEQIEIGIQRIHNDAAADLLERLHDQVPAFFEQAVIDLVAAMGYGGADKRATRTQLSNDGGIDGIVDQDVLGLSRVYIQAKRYALDSSVGRPEIQAFVGALQGQQATQGVFITTGRFSSGAIEYAKAIATRVVLIDGKRLAQLMIKYGVGVQVKRTLHIIEIDEDFFE